MKSSLKQFDSHLMNFMIYGLSFGENQAHFLKSSFHLEKKHDLFWKFANVLINELYKKKKINGKISLGINALLLPNYKKHFRAQKNTKEMDFQIHRFPPFFGPPYHALTLSKVVLLLCNVNVLAKAT
jgi:hypothetical protein